MHQSGVIDEERAIGNPKQALADLECSFAIDAVDQQVVLADARLLDMVGGAVVADGGEPEPSPDLVGAGNIVMLAVQ